MTSSNDLPTFFNPSFAAWANPLLANKPVALAPPVNGAAIIAAGLANVLTISRSIGDIKGFAEGGIVPGQGNRDTVPAMLTPGEVILNQAQQENLAGGMGAVTVNIQGDFLGSEEQADKLANIIEDRARLGFNRISTDA